MSVEKKVPEIRFEGFSVEWEEKNLGEIGSLKNGMNFDKSAMGHGHPFVNLQDVFGKNEVSSKHLGLAFSTENQRKDYSLNEGDVLFIRSSVKPEGVGEAAVVSKGMENTTYSGFIIRFRPNIEMDVNFNRFVYSTANSRKQILASSTSSANSNINQDALQRIQLALPCKPEQTQIGNTFQKLDSLINQHQQKHDKLSNIKKSMLEKMFPKQGETTPEIRFKGFSGEWERASLGDVGDTFTGLSGKTKDDFGHGEGRFVTYMNVFSNAISDETLIEPIEIDSFQNEVKLGDVFFTTSSETPEEVGMSSVWMGEIKNVYLNSFCFGYRPRQNFDNYYLAYMLRSFSFREKIIFLAQGISRYNISKKKVLDIKVRFPNFEEQTAIGHYFQKLDTLINQHQQQIIKLNNIKQACLSKMFV